jgi:hypothetical protein
MLKWTWRHANEGKRKSIYTDVLSFGTNWRLLISLQLRPLCHTSCWIWILGGSQGQSVHFEGKCVPCRQWSPYFPVIHPVVSSLHIPRYLGTQHNVVLYTAGHRLELIISCSSIWPCKYLWSLHGKRLLITNTVISVFVYNICVGL